MTSDPGGDLFSLLSQADPETLKLMMQAGVVPGLNQIQQERLGIAGPLMATEQPKGAQVGNTYVAASPLEHLSAALRQVVGRKMAENAMQRQTDLQNQLMQGRLGYAGMLAKQRAAAVPSAPVQQNQPAGSDYDLNPTSDI